MRSKESSVNPIDYSTLIPFSGGDAHDMADPVTTVATDYRSNWIQLQNGHYFRVGDMITIPNKLYQAVKIAFISGSWMLTDHDHSKVTSQTAKSFSIVLTLELQTLEP